MVVRRRIVIKKNKVLNTNLPHSGSLSAPVYLVVDPVVTEKVDFKMPLSKPQMQWFVDRLSKHGGFRKEDVFIISCAPPCTPATWESGRATTAHLKLHRPELLNLIEVNKPKFIVPFGAKACQQIIGRAVQITKLRGQPIQDESIVGGIPLLPMLSPFYAQRQPENEAAFTADLMTAGRIYKADYDVEASAIDYKHDYRWCYNLDWLIKLKPTRLSVDVETRGLSPFDPKTRLLTVQICWEPGKSVIIPIDYDRGDLRHHNFIPWGDFSRKKLIAQLKQLMEDPKIEKFGQNFKFDWLQLWYKLGIQTENYADDTQLLAHLIDENQLKLNIDDLVRMHVPEMSGYNDQYNNDPDHHGKTRMDLLPPDKMLPYGCGDTDAAWRLCDVLHEKLMEDSGLVACYNRVTMPAQRAFCHIELNGFPVSREDLSAFEHKLRMTQKFERMYLLRQIPKSIKDKWRNSGVGLKVTRADILRDWLYLHPDGLRLEPKAVTKTGIPSISSKQALPYYVADYPVIARLIDYIKNDKLLNTYVKGFYKYIYDGMIRPSYSLVGTVTGRSSSRDPNGQNFPKRGKLAKEYRKIFKAPPGWVFLSCDLSQAELRIAAMMSGDPSMLKVYADGGDIHRTTAAGTMGITLDEFFKLPKDVQDLKRFQAKCYSGDTEILTDNGFVRFDCLPRSAKVAQWHTDGSLDFVAPTAHHKYADQETLHITDGNTDLVVTKNHRLPIVSRYTGRLRVVEAINLSDSHKTGSWLSHHAGKLPDGPHASAGLTQFLVMVQADGSYTPEGGIRFGFSKKRKIDRCRALLKQSGATYSEHVNYSTGVTTFQIPASDPVAISTIGWMPTKEFHYGMLHIVDKEAFLAELPIWDGHAYSNSQRGLVNYTNKSRASVEFAQGICAMSSRTSNVVCGSDGCYRLSYRRCDHNAIKRNNWTVVPAEKQDVYSVSVPSTYIIVRRNGKVTVSGNSVNFGFLYGMWWVKFRQYAKTEYGIDFTDEEAKEIRENFFRTYPMLEQWHSDVQSVVMRQGYIRTFDGRIRHLPGVRSPDQSVAKQAMRQGINCLSDDTQILTANGWKTVDEISKGDMAYTVDPLSMIAELHPIEAIHQSYVDQTMHVFDHNAFSAIATPNHRWLVEKNGHNRFIESDKLSKFGHEKIWLSGAGVDKVSTEWTDDEVTLAGWVLTDGYYKKQLSKDGAIDYSHRTVGITQSKETHLDDLYALAARLDMRSRVTKAGQHIFTLTSDAAERIRLMMPDRTLTPEFMQSLSRHQLDLLYNTMLAGDGSYDYSTFRYRNFTCATTRQKDMFLMLCSLVGQTARATWRDMSRYTPVSSKMKNSPNMDGVWTVEICVNKKAQPQYGYSKKQWKGRVWCPTLKHGTWIAKRDNKVFITGNSPVQSIASDLGLMTLGRLMPYLRKMKYDEWFKPCGFIHDAVVCLVREDMVAKAAAILKHYMENNPLEKWFGWTPEIPIIADAEVGRTLASTYELKPEQFQGKNINRSFADLLGDELAALQKKLADEKDATKKAKIQSSIEAVKADMALSLPSQHRPRRVKLSQHRSPSNAARKTDTRIKASRKKIRPRPKRSA